MEVSLKTYTPRPEYVCAEAAKTCYSARYPCDIALDEKEVKEMLERTIRSGHHSVLEHASFTFNVAGISRVTTHQLVRHRIASYSQQSQRYVNLKKPEYVTPPSLKDGEHWEVASIYDDYMKFSWDVYQVLMKYGVSGEDARYVLPNAAKTNIVITMNARELLHFFELRMCNRAQWEIRELANKMYEECMKVAPGIFQHTGPKCWTSKCTEEKPCGNPPKRRG